MELFVAVDASRKRAQANFSLIYSCMTVFRTPAQAVLSKKSHLRWLVRDFEEQIRENKPKWFSQATFL